MCKQIITVALAGSLGLTGTALLVPSLANAQTPSPTAAVTDRLTVLEDALKSLVADDTITQAQADRVAQTLAEQLPARGEGRGHRGGHHGARLDPAVVAEAAGATVEELRAAREAGQTLAQLAQGNGVSRATLIDRLVEAGEAALAEQVTEGDLTQAQADAEGEGLRERVSTMVDRVGGPRASRGHAHGDDAAAPAPSATS